jgi:hypothetical protein
MTPKIEKLLAAILAELQSLDLPRKPKAAPKPGFAFVTSVTRDVQGNMIITSDGYDADVPPQLSEAEREAQRWERRPRRVSSGPTVARQAVEDRSGRVR